MDIKSKSAYPSCALSNFAPHPFIIDGVECASMEGFLQALKFKEPDIQVEVCKLVGIKAKMRGKNKNWHRNQKLYWLGQEYDRQGAEYQILLDRAYNALSQNEKFKKALLATGNATLTHSIGRQKKNETVLTRSEFCSRLTRIRNTLNENRPS